MGGDIKVCANENQGSTFTFSFRLEEDYNETIDGVDCSFGNSVMPEGLKYLQEN